MISPRKQNHNRKKHLLLKNMRSFCEGLNIFFFDQKHHFLFNLRLKIYSVYFYIFTYLGIYLHPPSKYHPPFLYLSLNVTCVTRPLLLPPTNQIPWLAVRAVSSSPIGCKWSFLICSAWPARQWLPTRPPYLRVVIELAVARRRFVGFGIDCRTGIYSQPLRE